MKITKLEKLYHELKQLDHDIKLLLVSERFNDRMLVLRRKFGIPDEGFEDNKSENAKKDTYSKAELDEIESDLYKVIGEFEVLTARWYQSLQWYLFQNVPGAFMSRPTYELKLEGNPSDHKDVQYVWIKVDVDTDIRNVTEAYHAAKEYLNPRGNNRPITYIDDAIIAKSLKGQDITWAKVAEKVEQITKHQYDETRMRKLVDTLNNRIP